MQCFFSTLSNWCEHSIVLILYNAAVLKVLKVCISPADKSALDTSVHECPALEVQTISQSCNVNVRTIKCAHFCIAGTSSFGLSGVNCHAILARPASEQKPPRWQPNEAQQWRRLRCWAAPRVDLLLSFALPGFEPKQRAVMFVCLLHSAQLAYLQDHRCTDLANKCLK